MNTDERNAKRLADVTSYDVYISLDTQYSTAILTAVIAHPATGVVETEEYAVIEARP